MVAEMGSDKRWPGRRCHRGFDSWSSCFVDVSAAPQLQQTAPGTNSRFRLSKDVPSGHGRYGVRSLSLAPPLQSPPVLIVPMASTSLSRGDALLLDATLLMVGIRMTALRVRLHTVGQRGKPGHR